jgi:hypothetical protein
MTKMMMAIAVIKTIILLIGGGITYIAFKAYRKSGDTSIGVLGIGFGVITVGAFVTGLANQFLSVSLATGVLVNSIFVAVGLAIIMYSLYMKR